ncbi:SIS domain-containing protein [Sphaerisporangium sp. TRM90804]|uniref:SIS domain-containing protein n=1 Tax=Sphaerisporangium sp. TRM90804 TaxID=3031113 RepID=UPI00244848CB|nr:SIS domain-containing protein [Sphaerisporangium sp. TRM90804]MDH2427094.1 SIS domain-containing protein [Sphaerisporangium sp. TRM90804]
MLSRLDRYEAFLKSGYRAGFLKWEEYSLEEVTDELRDRMARGDFTRVVFSGMGCSAIVSDVIQTFLKASGCELEIHVFNDYEFTYLVPPSITEDERTLFVISSYSGHSEEPIRVLEALDGKYDRTLLLTSGGRLAELGRKSGVSIARWELSEPDREYPLFHVGQYFAILLDMFLRLGLVKEDHLRAVAALPEHLETDFSPRLKSLARITAERSTHANVIMIASPKWHGSLLKLAKMHINEMAMTPATRNYFHEFCHSEVATLSDPERRHSLLLFTEDDDDEYTRRKMDNLVDLLTRDVPQNRNIVVTQVHLDQPTFMRKYFTALEFVQWMALGLGRAHETKSRDLISEAAGNPWYHHRTIMTEALARA